MVHKCHVTSYSLACNEDLQGIVSNLERQISAANARVSAAKSKWPADACPKLREASSRPEIAACGR